MISRGSTLIDLSSERSTFVFSILCSKVPFTPSTVSHHHRLAFGELLLFFITMCKFSKSQEACQSITIAHALIFAVNFSIIFTGL